MIHSLGKRCGSDTAGVCAKPIDRDAREPASENKSTSYPRGMREAIESLNVQIDNLNDELQSLAHQLVPVLAPDVPKETNGTKVSASVSPFVDAIEIASDKLVDMRMAMNSLADRLRL
jgi:hypothetical protein